jgi:transcription elongation factor GreA
VLSIGFPESVPHRVGTRSIVCAVTDSKYQMTQETLDALEAELHQLENEERQKIAERIRIAREWGDLKENAEYHDAKNSQAHLETKILRLRDRTRNAVVVESAAGATRAGLGSTVTVADEAGKERTYELVAASEGDPAKGKLSVDSPLGNALLGTEVGDTASYETPRGFKQLKILSLS